MFHTNNFSKIKRPAPGYLLIMTLLIITIITMMVTYIFYRSMVYVPFSVTMIDREKAKQLALGGINLGKRQLMITPDKEGGKEKKSDQKNESLLLLTQVLPSINRWQEFVLRQDIDGIDARLLVCIVCEEGKIDINSIYNFEKHTFKEQETSDVRAQKKMSGQETKKRLDIIFKRIENEAKKQGLMEALEKFLKKRQYKLNDVSELLEIKEFKTFSNNLFYEPPTMEEKNKKRPLYLTDIFTVYSGKPSIEPWLFSDSITGIFGLARAQAGDINERKKKIKEWTKPFKEQSSWKEDWNKILKPLYGKELQTLPEGIDSMLSKTFEPKHFTIFAYATVGSVTQRACAVVERYKRSEEKKLVDDVRIKKLYWL